MLADILHLKSSCNSENLIWYAETRIAQRGFFQGTAEDLPDEFSYKALCRAAILSVFFRRLWLAGLVLPSTNRFAVSGTLFAGLAFYNLKKYPAELTGKLWATIGGVLGSILLVGAPAKHAYIYLTEVPEGYERISFAAWKSPMGGAPDVPTIEAMKLSGKKIFLKGYIHQIAGEYELQNVRVGSRLGNLLFSVHSLL